MSDTNDNQGKLVSAAEWVRPTGRPDPSKRVLPSPANQGAKATLRTVSK